MSFRVLEFELIQKGGFVGKGKILLPSGLILSVNVFRSKNDPAVLVPFPLSPKNAAGVYTPAVEFVSDDVRKAWQAQVMAALGPRLADLAATEQRKPDFESF